MEQTEKEKEKKQITIFKSVQISKENKEKFFKVERNNNYNTMNINTINNNNSQIIEKETNQIFKTHKECHPFSNIPKKTINQNNSGIFITTHNETNTNKNLMLINKNTPKAIRTINKNKERNNIDKLNLSLNKNIYYHRTEQNTVDNRLIHKKLNLVYFESVKNLCNHLNQNFIQLVHYKQIVNLNEYLNEMYQNLQILNRKIDLLKNQNNFQPEKEEFDPLLKLKYHLINMNKVLNNNMSQNIINIYINLNNFCSKYST